MRHLSIIKPTGEALDAAAAADKAPGSKDAPAADPKNGRGDVKDVKGMSKVDFKAANAESAAAKGRRAKLSRDFADGRRKSRSRRSGGSGDSDDGDSIAGDSIAGESISGFSAFMEADSESRDASRASSPTQAPAPSAPPPAAAPARGAMRSSSNRADDEDGAISPKDHPGSSEDGSRASSPPILRLGSSWRRVKTTKVLDMV